MKFAIHIQYPRKVHVMRAHSITTTRFELACILLHIEIPYGLGCYIILDHKIGIVQSTTLIVGSRISADEICCTAQSKYLTYFVHIEYERMMHHINFFCFNIIFERNSNKRYKCWIGCMSWSIFFPCWPICQANEQMKNTIGLNNGHRMDITNYQQTLASSRPKIYSSEKKK